MEPTRNCNIICTKFPIFLTISSWIFFDTKKTKVIDRTLLFWKPEWLHGQYQWFLWWSTNCFCNQSKEVPCNWELTMWSVTNWMILIQLSIVSGFFAVSCLVCIIFYFKKNNNCQLPQASIWWLHFSNCWSTKRKTSAPNSKTTRTSFAAAENSNRIGLHIFFKTMHTKSGTSLSLFSKFNVLNHCLQYKEFEKIAGVCLSGVFWY